MATTMTGTPGQGIFNSRDDYSRPPPADSLKCIKCNLHPRYLNYPLCFACLQADDPYFVVCKHSTGSSLCRACTGRSLRAQYAAEPQPPGHVRCTNCWRPVLPAQIQEGWCTFCVVANHQEFEFSCALRGCVLRVRQEGMVCDECLSRREEIREMPPVLATPASSAWPQSSAGTEVTPGGHRFVYISHERLRLQASGQASGSSRSRSSGRRRDSKGRGS